MMGRRESLGSRRFWRFLALAFVAGCAPSGPYAPPTFPFLPSYHGATRTTPVLLQNANWWQGLRDPVLNRLVAMALAGSPTLAAARARVGQAAGAYAATPGLLSLAGTAQAGSAGVVGSPPARFGTADPSLTWLLDPYGAHRAQENAAAAQVTVAQAELDAARLLLLYNLGNAYVELRYRQTLLILQDQDMQSSQKILTMTQTLVDAKDATKLDVTRSQARLADLATQRPALVASIKGKANEIAVLAGAAPGALPADLARALERSGAQPRPTLSPDVGIPTDLLRNRPDIQIAERQYYVALQGLTQAQAALYPQLSLIGTLTLRVAQNGQTANSYNFGPQLTLPALPLSNGLAVVTQARAAIDAACATWKSTVLTALQEVENAMLDYQAAATSQHLADTAAGLYGQALEMTRKVFSQGDATLTDMILAQQTLATAQQTQAQTVYLRGQSFIALNVRLGAGNSVEAAAAP